MTLQSYPVCNSQELAALELADLPNQTHHLPAKGCDHHAFWTGISLFHGSGRS